MPTTGSGTSKVLWVVVIATCMSIICVAAAVLMFVLMNKDDPLMGLPTLEQRPRLKTIGLDGMVESMFYMKSGCWDFNHWARVTLPLVLGELDDMYVLTGQAITAKNKALFKSLWDRFVATYMKLGAEFRNPGVNCPGDATVTVKRDGIEQSISVKDFLALMKADADRNYQDAYKALQDRFKALSRVV